MWRPANENDRLSEGLTAMRTHRLHLEIGLVRLRWQAYECIRTSMQVLAEARRLVPIPWEPFSTSCFKATSGMVNRRPGYREQGRHDTTQGLVACRVSLKARIRRVGP